MKFEVSLPFLLQQAAWLYERHFEGMRAQMKKLGVSGTPGPSASPQPVQGEGGGSAFAVGGVGMVRTGSKGMLVKPVSRGTLLMNSKDSKAPPAIFTQKTSPLPTGEASSPTTPRFNRPEASRTPSTNTVTQSRVFTSSPRPPSQPIGRPSTSSKRRAPRPEQMHDSSQDEDDNSGLGHDGASESESEEEPSAMARSQAFRRSQLSKKPVMSTLSSDGDAEDDDDDDDSGGYLPFAASSKNTKDDPAATLRNSPRQQTAVPQQPSVSKGKSKEQPPDSSTSVSSNSSAQQTPSNNDHADSNNRPGPLSPRHRTELEKLSPRYKKSGSEGSPSMGSSFSDLDDASVTKSALEDALLSNMQHGSIGMGMGSRISTMRDALGRK